MLTISDSEIKKLADYIKLHYGVDVTQKAALVRSRLGVVIERKGYSSLEEYFNYALNDRSGQEIDYVLTRLTTNFTYFMRENDHFDFVAKVALPQIEKSSQDKEIRVWSAACSSGEEPYTLAMIIDNYLGFKKSQWNVSVKATDISARVLDIAEKGTYSAESLKNVPEDFKRKYFKSLNDNEWQVAPAIKEMVAFDKFNLLQKSYAFSKKPQIIFCRNVLMYFDAKTKEEVVNKLYHSLEKDGYLFLGHSEPIPRSSRFENVKSAVYKKA